MKFLKVLAFIMLCSSFNIKASTSAIETALNVLKTQKTDSNKINTHNFLCWNYSDLREGEKSIFYAQEAIKITSY